MRSVRLPLLLLAAWFAACATTVTIPQNRHGLEVVPDFATYQRLTSVDREQTLLNLATLGIPLDIRYATDDNFMHRVLYPVATAWLRAPAALELAAVREELAIAGLGIKVFDAYRPYRVTEAMWEPIRNPDYVADPSKGSRHNRGAAVDLTLIDLATGAELVMPTPYDDFTPRARHDFTDLPAEALANRARLRDVMVRHGFEPIGSEWWHYDFKGWERFPLMDVPLEQLR